ncbi:MAG: VOC family protein [Actinomycetota bacterium]
MSSFSPEPPERRGGRPTDRTIFQNCWVVDDIESAALDWARAFGVGPFFVSELGDSITDVEYRGGPGRMHMLVALAQAGPMQIELIQPLADGNAYRDAVPAGSGITFHHVGVWSHDFEADVEHFVSLGYPVVNRALAGGRTRFAYLDTRPLLGAMYELVDHHPAIQQRFEAIANVCAGWDGVDPLRDAADL